MSREAIRVTNLRRLVAEHKTIAEVARRSATDPSYLSQVMNGHKTKQGKSRTIGNDLADRIEKGCNKPTGWLDQNHGNESSGALSEDELRLVELYRKADSALRRHMMALAKCADE